MLFTVACGQLGQQHYEGAGAGAVVGGVAGALLDKKNPWRGGVIGAA
ncbi:MAG: glycine zipper 2TM domain-containing protein, partial [Thermodesulfovibrio sp.]